MNQDGFALGHECFAAAGARFVRNTRWPWLLDANHVDTVTAQTPTEIDAVLARAEVEYAHCEQICFDLDARTPPEFEARLRLDGYAPRVEVIVSALEGELRADPKPFDIRPIEDEAGWEAWTTLHALDWAGDNPAEALETERAAANAVTLRGKAPPARFWLARVDGAPRGYVWSWVQGGIGQVETLFVHPEYRRRGIATALLARGVADCRERGAGPVILAADAGDTPKAMYAALGWRPLAVKRSYVRERRATP